MRYLVDTRRCSLPFDVMNLRLCSIPTWIILAIVAACYLTPTLLSPLSEGHRNAQTATLTSMMIENGRLRIDPIASWRGDLDARLVQELPIYNLTIITIQSLLPFIPLDIAGRCISLIFWCCSVYLIQKLWRRTLDPSAHLWANILYIFSPMSLYLASAFMPETLLMALTVGFLCLAWDYSLSPSYWRLLCLTVVSMLGLLVKLPAFSHLSIVLAMLILERQGWRFLFKPRHIVAGLCVITVVFLWGKYIEVINSSYFNTWCGIDNVISFIRPEASRLTMGYWLTLAAYNLSFIIPISVAWLAVPGIVAFSKSCKDNPASRFWIYYGISLFFYWSLWGKAAPAQNYYNLPNLIFFSALVGVGFTKFINNTFLNSLPNIARHLFRFIIYSILVLSCHLGVTYLSQPDKYTISVADWIKSNTSMTDLIIYQPRHDPRVIDYEHQPLLSHLSGRRTWIWTRSTPEWEKELAVQKSSYLVVTHPKKTTTALGKIREFFKGTTPPVPASVHEIYQEKYMIVYQCPSFTIYKNRSL